MEYNIKQIIILCFTYLVVMTLYAIYTASSITRIETKINKIEQNTNTNEQMIENDVTLLLHMIESSTITVENLNTLLENLNTNNSKLSEIVEEVKIEQEKLKNNQKLIEEKIKKYEEQRIEKNSIVNDKKHNLENSEFAGHFSVTAYTAGPLSCGIHSDGYTATGDKADWKNRIIAADWNVLPPDTVVYVENMGTYTVKDRGSAVKGNTIDILMSDRSKALNFGRKTLKVWIINPY